MKSNIGIGTKLRAGQCDILLISRGGQYINIDIYLISRGENISRPIYRQYLSKSQKKLGTTLLINCLHIQIHIHQHVTNSE